MAKIALVAVMASRGAKVEIRKARRRVRAVAIPDPLFGAPVGSLPPKSNRLSGLAGTSSLPFPMSFPASSTQATGAVIRPFGVKGGALDWAAMEVSGTTQRRRISRRRVFKGAQISFRGLRAAIDCTIHDISEVGARLLVESPVGVPDRFDLVQNGAAPRFCRVVWRKATQIGVEFI